MVASLLARAVLVGGLLVTSAAHGETIIVYPPSGIDLAVATSSPGDSILVMPGVYHEGGSYITHKLTIIGFDGATANRIEIDPWWESILFQIRPEAGDVIIDGLTMTRYPPHPGLAWGILVQGSPSVIVRNCVFVDLSGMAVQLFTIGPQVRIENNLFLQGLSRSVSVVAIDPVITNNTFTLSRGIVLDEGASATITNNLFFRSPDAVVCLPTNPSPNPSFACNDMWENSRNYFGCQDPTGMDGNIALDPLLCDPESQDFRLLSGSPCLPENSPPGCGLIGAFGSCAVTAVEGAPTSRVGLTVEPNPILTAGEFSFAVELASPALEIYDLQGRLMQILIPEDRRAVWVPDASVPRGVYFARLRGAKGSEVVKFAIVR